MPRKSLYIRPEDVALWEKAERLAEGNVSRLIARLLREHFQKTPPLLTASQSAQRLAMARCIAGHQSN